LFAQQCYKNRHANFPFAGFLLDDIALIFPSLGRLQMWWLLATTCCVLLSGPIDGYKQESITNPEANMNIVSHSLRKK
jgi:hypothetical protein